VIPTVLPAGKTKRGDINSEKRKTSPCRRRLNHICGGLNMRKCGIDKETGIAENVVGQVSQEIKLKGIANGETEKT
jgi:hypothetical protein